MTRPPSTPSNERTGRRNVRDIDALKKRGPERWVYVGGGSTLCPAWQNGADHAGSPYDPVGFRFGVHGDLEFKGVVDVSAFTSGDVAWTMPAEYVPENDLPVATFVWNGSEEWREQGYMLDDPAAFAYMGQKMREWRAA